MCILGAFLGKSLGKNCCQITILVTYLGYALLREQLSVTIISLHECLFILVNEELDAFKLARVSHSVDLRVVGGKSHNDISRHFLFGVLQTNVSSVSSPMPKFFSKPLSSLKTFHDDRLV